MEQIAFAPITAYSALREIGGITGITSTTPGQFVATGGRDKMIKIWDSTSGQCIKTLTGHDNWIRGLCWSPDGQYLLSCSDDKTIKIWDLRAGARCSKTVEAHDHFGGSFSSILCMNVGLIFFFPSFAVTSISWARARTDAGPRPDGPAVNGAASNEAKTVNAVVTTSVDLSIRIWTP